MAPLFKVTIEALIGKTFMVRAEDEDLARGIALEYALDDSSETFKLIGDEVENVEETEDIDEDEVLSR